ncbi:MAG: glycoside hydrolase family 38 C-terminal domain-containing protein [Bacteroidota bacterium]|nr:glycoside hydrolase family 38 C-terminal domain-containing protein [Bacteroidota bacterium]
MKSICSFLITCILSGMLSAQAQTVKTSSVILKNAPVLFKKEGKMFQQIIADVKSDKPAEISFYIAGKEIQKTGIKKGDNLVLLTVPDVSTPKKINVSVKGDPDLAGSFSFIITPVKKWEVYLVQHSHTDIGYTRPQSEILAEHMRYIDYALDYCDQTDAMPNEAKFRWTCESAWVTREYLRSRPTSQIERLKKRIAEGRIEVTGMYCNMAEISDENIMYDFLQPLKEFSKLGIPVKTAMQDDVNGIAWCMPDYFKNTGVKYLDMGINKTRSLLPFDIPTCFWWEAPSGERLLAFRADHYMTGNFFGFESKEVKHEKILGHLANLDEKNYPFDRIAIQFSGYFTDNAPPSTAACELVRQWNATYESPKLKLSVASEFFEYVEKNYASTLPVYRNAWLDWWTDGYGSTSRETAEVRKTQNMKQVDEGMFAMVSMLGGELNPALEGNMDHISENAIFFDEHTCGADESIDRPFSENSTRQWLQKGAYAWEALKKVTLLNEEALARLQVFMKKADFPIIYVVNSLGWKRSGTVELFIDFEVLPLHQQFKITDISTGKAVTAQVVRERREGAYWILDVPDVPALGYKALKIEVTNEPETKTNEHNNTEILENAYYKIVIDKSTGAIRSLFDKELNQELVDPQNPWKLGRLIHETLPDRNKMTPTHSSVSNVKVESGSDGQVWESIRIKADMEGFEKGKENDPKGLELEIRLFKNVKKIDFQYKAAKEIVTSPEALYVAFPFALPKSRIVFETIGGILSQGQQLPGSSSDWNAAQNFVSVRGTNSQIVVVSNEIPLWQFSDLNIGKFEPNPKPGKTWLYSWVMNNYWFTNFRAFQEGGFHWSYQITSTKDTTNTFATKFAWGERNAFATRTFPAGKNEFQSPVLETVKISGSPNAILINSRPAFKNSGSILLHFRELEGKLAELALESKIAGRSIKRMVEVNVIGKEIGNPIHSIKLKPFEVKFVEVDF